MRGGGGLGGGDGEDAEDGLEVGVGGTEVGGAVCTFGAGGGGGVNGILSGLIAESEEGTAGDVGLPPTDSTTPPGGGGISDFASEL